MTELLQGRQDDFRDKMQEALSALVTLASYGAASPSATDTEKWKLGDAIGAMQEVIQQAEQSLLNPEVRAAAADKVLLREWRGNFQAFLNGQRFLRATLIDLADVARTFPPGDPMRTEGLSFSHARAVSRLATPEERAAWTARALRERLSVERLQAAINMAAQTPIHSATQTLTAVPQTVGVPTDQTPNGGTGHTINRNKRTSQKPKKSQHTFRCAQTGHPITDLLAMVEVRLHLNMAEEASARAARRGGAARAVKLSSGTLLPRRFWFKDRGALLAWLTPAENTSEASVVTSKEADLG